jgi:outer membrane usher protein FimD/PapC
MNKTRLNLLAAFTAILLATLACNFSASTAKITDAYLAFDEGGTQKTTVYTPTDQFFVIVVLANAPSDTVTKAVWTGVELANGEKNVKLVENEFTSGNKKVYFTASGDWSVGKYKVDIYLNDKLDRTLEFEVKSAEESSTEPTAQTPASAHDLIQSAYLARDENGTDVVSAFFPMDTFYAIVEMPNVPANTVAKAIWYAVDAEGLAPNSELDLAEVQGTGTFTFDLNATDPWPPGKYKAAIFVNGEPAIDLEFEVVPEEGAPPASAASGLISNAYLSSDEAGQQVTSVFGGADIIYANVEMPDAPADTLVRADWYVVEAAGVEPNSIIDQAETTGTGSFTFNLTPSNPWLVGKYRVEIYVNGELAKIMEYEVQ